ncbi:PglZ domain-containing protein [Agathobacter rectalis]|uniref:PglZ domain-containing protein n=1 Tax=Agathobacter rectalis TaxID=39491 RepID=A0A413Q2W1_9FIRM|nr:PglZ domain-containing protein [Agathobacter rectalis]
MIEKWLRNEIDKKICNSNRIVILDQSSRWKFLVDAACTDICLYSTKDYSSKWQQKQDELFLRHEIEKNHKNDQVVIYVSRKLAADSFLIEYAKTGGCIELATEWVRDVLLKETSLQVSLTDDELYTACQLGIFKDINWWKKVVQKIEGLLSIENDILDFFDNPNGFLESKTPAVKNLYIQEFCKLLQQPVQDKPADTFASEIARHIFTGMLEGNISEKEYVIYCKWIDSRNHESSFKKYLGEYQLPSTIDIDKVKDNHCFDVVDKKYLTKLVENINNASEVKNILDKIKKRLRFKKSNPYIAKWWQDIADIMDFTVVCNDASIDGISRYYTVEFSKTDRSMRRILTYLKADINIVKPIQECYERMNQDLLKSWFAHYGEYQESQKGYLVNLIKNTSKKIAIIVGDGVRYEVADSVASRVASDISVDKKFMYAGLPSETEHNMSALYTTDGEIIAEKKEREKKLSDETGKDITYMQLDEVNGTTDGEILVLTYKDIDDAGEKMQQGMLRLVDEFEDILVEKIQLLLHLGYKEVHLVTDHGFVLTGILEESDKIPTDDISGGKEVSERYIRSVDEQSGSKYISIEEHYENYNYVNFAKSSRPFVSTGKYGYSHGGFTPQEVVIPNFVFTYNKQNQMDVDITNKKDLIDIAGNILTVKFSSCEAKDVLSYQRKVRVLLYVGDKIVDKSSIISISPGSQEKVELSLDSATEGVVVIIDEDTKDQLDKAKVTKSQMRDLGGLF